MTIMVISPSGSLNDFTDKFNSIDAEIANAFNELVLYLD